MSQALLRWDRPGGTEYFWDPRQEVGEKPLKTEENGVKRKENALIFQSDMLKPGFPAVTLWFIHPRRERGFQGCPTVGSDNECWDPKP